MNEQRLAYFTGSYPALTETFVQREIAFLRKRGWSVKIFAFARAQNVQSGSLRAYVNTQTEYGRYRGIILGVFIQFIYLLRNPSGYFRCLWLLARQFATQPLSIAVKQLAYFLVAITFSWSLERNEIEHIHAHFATASTLAFFVHLLTGRTFSMTAHASGDIYTNPIMLEEKLGAATFIVAVSAYNRVYLNLLTQDRYAGKIYIVYNGVDVLPLEMV